MPKWYLNAIRYLKWIEWVVGWLVGWYVLTSDYRIRFLVSFVGSWVLSQHTSETNAMAITIAIQIVNTHTRSCRQRTTSKCTPKIETQRRRQLTLNWCITTYKDSILSNNTQLPTKSLFGCSCAAAAADDYDDVDDESLSAFIIILCIKWERNVKKEYKNEVEWGNIFVFHIWLLVLIIQDNK